MTKASRGKTREFIIIGKDSFATGDDILVNGDGAKLPFVGRIKSFKNKTSDLTDTLVRVNWYYRPEECKSGRKQFHGEKELFRSDHFDWIEAQTISGKCIVHTLGQYRELEDEVEDDYYTRFTYTPSKDRFGPESVPVYCVCELPYNPDTCMIMCEPCGEWYHPRCIGLSPEDVRQYEGVPFICRACLDSGG